MENQPQTAEQKERQERAEAARKLLKVLEGADLPEAIQITSLMLAYLLRSCRIDPYGDHWQAFFPAFETHVADQVEALDSVPSPLVH